ncbi:Protein SRE-3, partial [Aphelenchoides avenae]
MATSMLLHVLTALNVLELITIPFTMALAFLMFHIAYRHPIFHRNLMCLIANIWVHWLLGMTCRMVMVVWLFFDTKSLLSDEVFVTRGRLRVVEFMRIFCFGTILGTVASIVVERSVATIQLRSYEKQRSWTIVAGSLVYAWINGATGTYFVWQQSFSLMIPAIVGTLYSIGFVTIFATVERINRERYRRSRRGISTFTLSQRFQLSENIRSLTVIRRCLYAAGIGFAVVMVAIAVSYLDKTIMPCVAREVVNFAVFPFTVAFVWAAVASISAWSKEFW